MIKNTGAIPVWQKLWRWNRDALSEGKTVWYQHTMPKKLWVYFTYGASNVAYRKNITTLNTSANYFATCINKKLKDSSWYHSSPAPGQGFRVSWWAACLPYRVVAPQSLEARLWWNAWVSCLLSNLKMLINVCDLWLWVCLVKCRASFEACLKWPCVTSSLSASEYALKKSYFWQAINPVCLKVFPFSYEQFFSCNNYVHPQHKCGRSQFSPHADFRLATVRPLFCPFSLPNLGPNLALCLAHRSRGWTLYYIIEFSCHQHCWNITGDIQPREAPLCGWELTLWLRARRFPVQSLTSCLCKYYRFLLWALFSVLILSCLLLGRGVNMEKNKIAFYSCFNSR